MAAGVVIPLALGLAVALLTGVLHARVRPRFSALLLTGVIIGVSAAAVPTMVVLSFGFLTHLPVLGAGAEWCRSILGVHAWASPWLGGPATLALLVGTWRLATSVRAWRRRRCGEAGRPTLVPSAEWFAYSLPGPGRRIAVSTGLVEGLDEAELRVVLAHEESHARYRHDRYLLIGEWASAMVPVVEPLRRRLRFALERWADESAVEMVGGDREQVAHTLARVAMGPSELRGSLAAFNGVGVVDRVDALLSPRSLRYERAWIAAIALGVAGVMTAAVVQAHRLAELISLVC